MQKTNRLALAVLALLGSTAAFAQSSVTLYGRVNTTVERQELGNVKTTGLFDNNSRFGFKGTEDLGGGLKAGFNFETGLSLEDGSTAASGPGFWSRNANMWVGGNWGTFKMGRTLNLSFYGVAAWELTGTANYSVVANTYGYVGGGRNSSQFSYKTPDMGGLSAELGYIFKDDNAGAAKWDLNVVYANGPIAAGLSANKAKGQKVGYSIGGKYNFGNFAVAASYSDNHKVRRGFSIGGTATFGAASVTLDLTRDTKHPVKKYTNGLLEGKYALSKRTFLYAAYLRLDGENNYGLGVRHNF